MIPAAFGYQRPTSLDEALAAIASADGGVKVLAGGQSLLPLMKLRLARPETLVDIGRIAELRGVRPQPDGGLEIGALTTYAELLGSTSLQMAVEAISEIGDVQVRNRGTVSHARVALTGVGEVAYRARAVEAALLGSDGSATALAAAAEDATDGVTVTGDIHADSEYRTRMAAVHTRRALEVALGRSA